MRRLALVLALLSFGIAHWVTRAAQAPAPSAGLPPAATRSVDFTRDVAPVLARCQACHGAQQQMNGLRLDSVEAVLKGGYSGAAIVPGNSAGSLLIQRVASADEKRRMPPIGPALTAAEIGILRAWIDQGAQSTPAQAATTPSAPPPTQAGAKPAHWSFRPIARPEPPSVQNRAWVRNPIDAFVLARLESEGIQPAPEADRATLARRASLDLTGLPPTPQQVAAFLADKRPGAYEHLVDELLASPHYGEKWARHWLDLAHYADSDGYEKDNSRAWAWRYRHWVIEALNRDLPFDRFTIEQLAGDLLPGSTAEQKAATGFLRNTLTNREAGVSRAEVRFEQLVDRANTTSTTWLGLTAGCAQCHNHKYDPITQKDYYRLLAFFESTDETEVEAPLPGEIGPYLRALPEYQTKRDAILETCGVPDLQPGWENDLREAIAGPGRRLDWDFQITSMRAMVDGAERLLHTPAEKRSRRDSERLTDYFVGNFGPTIGKNGELAKKLRECRKQLTGLKSEFPEVSLAPAVVEMPDPPRGYIRLRGDYRQKGIEVDPGVPEFLPQPSTDGRAGRLALARWIVSRDNPLTARVAVNRMWQAFFGRGLVQTSEDFGAQGDKPSHPELLDWLAAEFMSGDANGVGAWSVKRLHRLIATSAAYRQSSRIRPELQQRDPENRLLARQGRLRLEAEFLRDAALASAGLLDPAIGGRSVKPPQPAGVAELAYANSVKWVESPGQERYRRGLYIHFQRTTPYPQLMTFDAPTSLVACSRRRVSNTPLQALNLLNDPVFFEAAQAFAARVLTSAPPEFDARLGYAFVLALSRKPSARERTRLAALLEKQSEALRGDARAAEALFPARLDGVDPVDAAAWTTVARVLLNLDEFVTRE